MNYSDQDRYWIRELATRVTEAAHRPEMNAIRKRWKDVNALRKPDRAPVWCKPIGAWDEIIPDSTLRCTHPWLRLIERHFLQILHKVEIGDDTTISPVFDIPAILTVSPANIWGVDIHHHPSQIKGGAWGFNPPLRTEEDFDKLVIPEWSFDKAASERAIEQAQTLLSNTMPIRLYCGPGYDSATLSNTAAELRGLEQIMIDMLDQPELMHRLMRHMRDARLKLLEFWEQTGLITPNTEEPMLCSDPIGELRNGCASLANCWCAGNSQEFDMASPEMWEEFCLDYQKPIFARFGFSCYGCCENLGRKIPSVLTIPNLRIFVCSAWTTLKVALDHVPEKYCIMWRQKASDVVLPHDEASIREDLIDGVKRLQGRPYQIVLRELQTLAGHPDRLHRWTRLAIDAAEQYA